MFGVVGATAKQRHLRPTRYQLLQIHFTPRSTQSRVCGAEKPINIEEFAASKTLINFMINEEWHTSSDALAMLEDLREHSLQKWEDLTPTLHRYFLACCKKIDHLLPQESIQAGLEGAVDFLDGKITSTELRRLEWHAEAAAFSIDYGLDSEKTRDQIKSIDAVRDLAYEDAWRLLKAAAYFADRAIAYSHMRSPKRLPGKQFLCPELLRELIPAPFDD